MTKKTKSERREALFKELPAKLREALNAADIMDIYDLEQTPIDDIAKQPGIGRAAMKKTESVLDAAAWIRSEPEPSEPEPSTATGITVEKLIYAMAKASRIYSVLAHMEGPGILNDNHHLCHLLDRQRLHEDLMSMPAKTLLHLHMRWNRESGELLLVPTHKVPV